MKLLIKRTEISYSNLQIEKANKLLYIEIRVFYNSLSLSSIVIVASDCGPKNIVSNVALVMATVKLWLHSSESSSIVCISPQTVSPSMEDVENDTCNVTGSKSSPATADYHNKILQIL